MREPPGETLDGLLHSERPHKDCTVPWISSMDWSPGTVKSQRESRVGLQGHGEGRMKTYCSVRKMKCSREVRGGDGCLTLCLMSPNNG
jgi:hypothetical protein